MWPECAGWWKKITWICYFDFNENGTNNIMSIVESPHTFSPFKNEATENIFQKRKIFITKTLSEPRAETWYFYKCLSFQLQVIVLHCIWMKGTKSSDITCKSLSKGINFWSKYQSEIYIKMSVRKKKFNLRIYTGTKSETYVNAAKEDFPVKS